MNQEEIMKYKHVKLDQTKRAVWRTGCSNNDWTQNIVLARSYHKIHFNTKICVRLCSLVTPKTRLIWSLQLIDPIINLPL